MYILKLSRHYYAKHWSGLAQYQSGRLLVCLLVLLVYILSQLLWSWWDGQFTYVTTHFSWASLNKRLTSTLCKYFRLFLTTALLEWFSKGKENDIRNYFMINLHESMGPGWDRTHDPSICSQTRICSQTHYRLPYMAWFGESWSLIALWVPQLVSPCSVGENVHKQIINYLLSTHSFWP